MRTRPLLAVLLLSTVTGCGGDGEEKNAYVERVQTAQRTYIGAFDAVGTAITPESTPRQDRATLATFSQATGTFVTAVKNSAPPESVRDENAALARALVAYRAEVDRARDQLQGADAAERRKVRATLVAGFKAAQKRIAAAILDINNGLRA